MNAEEFLIRQGCQRDEKHPEDSEESDFFHDVQPKDLVEFAKLKVKEALETAYENQVIEQFKREDKYDYPNSSHFRATIQSILNSYPLDSIK